MAVMSPVFYLWRWSSTMMPLCHWLYLLLLLYGHKYNTYNIYNKIYFYNIYNNG